jgi:hypothetical protein
MYPNYNLKTNYYRANQPMIRTSDDGRSLLLPFLVGAAVAFPIGYIASNTKNQYPYYQQPYYPQHPQYPPYYQQSYYYPTYY